MIKIKKYQNSSNSLTKRPATTVNTSIKSGPVTYFSPYYDYSVKGNPLTRNAWVDEVVVTADKKEKPSFGKRYAQNVNKLIALRKAGVRYVSDLYHSNPDAARNAGITFLKNLTPENQKLALDAVLHSTKGAEVLSGERMLNTVIPNYYKAIKGKPMDVNYTGNASLEFPTSDNVIVNHDRDLVNLYLKGDNTNFVDVTDDPMYSHGADYKSYTQKYYPGKDIRTYKMSSDGKPLVLNEGEYQEALENLNKPTYTHEGWTEGGDNVGDIIRWYKNIDGKLYAVDSDVWDFNPKDWRWEGDDNKMVDKAGTPFILKALRPVVKETFENSGYRKQGGKLNFLKKGNKIYIKKKNRGKFTDYCGGKVTDACIRRAKASGNPTLVKRATFAANARKWKH